MTISLELHFMLHQKFYYAKNIMKNVTFGQSESYFMKQFIINFHEIFIL